MICILALCWSFGHFSFHSISTVSSCCCCSPNVVDDDDDVRDRFFFIIIDDDDDDDDVLLLGFVVVVVFNNSSRNELATHNESPCANSKDHVFDRRDVFILTLRKEVMVDISGTCPVRATSASILMLF